ILRLELALLDQAEAHAQVPMPGYTHLQRAQPVTVGHHLLAHFWPLVRDDQRLSDCFARANVSPLGAAALAGSTLPIDPAIPARILGFAGSLENSIHAVTDRDYFARVREGPRGSDDPRSQEHKSELQSLRHIVRRLRLEH